MVQEGAHDAFVAAFKRAVEALQVGNGLDKGVIQTDQKKAALSALSKGVFNL